MEILKRAREFQSGERVSWLESEANVREEVNKRTCKAGYTNSDGSPIVKRGCPVVSRAYQDNYDQIDW